MVNNNMTIRFTPDGFSFTDAPFTEVDPGPDYLSRIQQQLLQALPESAMGQDLDCELLTTRVIALPPEVNDADQAALMYHTTVSQSEAEEQVILQSIELSQGQCVNLCFGIDRSLYLFLLRNFGELTIRHELSDFLVEASAKAAGRCLVVHCTAQTLMLAYFDHSHLGLVNVYRTCQAENRSYYVMNTWQQLGLDQRDDNLLVLGTGNEALQVRASLHRYIKHVFS